MNLKNKFLIAALVGTSFFSVALFAQAQTSGLNCNNGNGTCTYTPLEPLPSIFGLPPQSTFGGQTNGSDLLAYINLMFMLLIVLGAMLVVVRFSIGGIKYMTSTIVAYKNDARQQMWASIWGLLLLISSVLILRTINPQLINLNFFQDLQKLSTPAQ